MKNIIFFVAVCVAAPVLAGIAAYQLTAKTTPCEGAKGEVLAYWACSTNATGTVNVRAVTTLQASDGSLHSFTNTVLSTTLANGTASGTVTNQFVASRQILTVDGTAFPCGSVTIWAKE